MNHLAWLVPVALGMGLVGLAAFLWTMRSGQYDDLDGAAERVLLHEGQDTPLPDEAIGLGRPANAQSTGKQGRQL